MIQNRDTMRIDVVTLFPSFFEPIVNGSILGRAQAKDLVHITVHDLWKYVPAGERADDTPYGGGPGWSCVWGHLIACMESLLGPGLGRARRLRGYRAVAGRHTLSITPLPNG